MALLRDGHIIKAYFLSILVFFNQKTVDRTTTLFISLSVKLFGFLTRLITKASAHGTGREALDWIRAWLTDRKKRVSTDGVKSVSLAITGMPQGLVLGPLLFIKYINTLDTGVHSSVSEAANDPKQAGLLPWMMVR